MNKNCENCYWKLYEDKWCIFKDEEPNEKLCLSHNYTCEECDEEAAYKYKDKRYCIDCLLKEFDIESYKITHYSIDGEYLGSDDDMNEVINNLSNDIKDID